MNRKIPLWVVLLLFWLFCILTIIFGWAVWNIEENGNRFGKNTKIAVISVAKFPVLVREAFSALKQPIPLILLNKYPEINGLKIENKNYVDSNYILLSSFDIKKVQSTIKLIRLSDQKVVYQWAPNIDQIVKITQNSKEDALTRNNIIFRHPLLLTDGSVIVEVPSHLLFKIDKSSRLLWYIPNGFSHSLEFDAEGNIWGQAALDNSEFSKEYRDDAIVKISTDGKVLFEKSISEIFTENGYRGLLLGTGSIGGELSHLNDIQPALTAGAYWQKADLLISLRNKSTVFLYRPSTKKIIWLKTGPWLLQHDVNFLDSTRISVFGNNVVQNDGKTAKLIDGHNEEYIFDFRTNTISTPYTKFLKAARVRTLSEGRGTILPNGDVFIEETNEGRLLRGSPKSIIWQFVERIDRHSIAAPAWSRFITREEFKKLKFIQ